MRKWLVAAMALALIAGCGNQGDSGDAGGELTFASWQWLEPGRGEQLWKVVSGYTATDPAVTLKQQAVARKDYESTLKTQIGGRGGPDLLIIPDTFLPELADAGALEPLDDVVDQAALNATNQAGRVGGKQLGLAWEIVNYALFWNTKLLDEAGVEPPADVPGLIAAAKQIKTRTGNPGFAVRHQINEEAPWWIDFSNWTYGFGGRWSDGSKLTINSPENVAAVTAFRDMYASGAMAVGDDASTFRAKFKAGKVGMMIDNSSALATMVAGNDVVPSKGVGASKLPFPAPASSQAGFFVGVNKFGKNTEAAKKWLTWYYGAETQKQAAAALGASVLGTDAKPPAEFVTANPWVPTFQAQSATSADAVVDGFETNTPKIRHLVLTEVEKVLVDGEDPATALGRAQREAAKLR